MSPLSDLLTDLALDEERAAAATHDGPAELRTVLADARRAGRRRLAATVTASAAAVALAVTAATVLPEPVDRAPAQRDQATAAPAPVEPAPGPVTTGTGARGLVAPLPSPPRVAWTVPTAGLLPGADPLMPPRLGIRASLEPHGGRLAAAAGGHWLIELTDARGSSVVGIGVAAGTFGWARAVDAVTGGPPGPCAGVDRTGSLVCVGTGAEGGPAVQLVDPQDGRVVREVPVALDAWSVAVSGEVAVAHGAGADGDPAWAAVSTRTGATLWAGDDPEPPTGASREPFATYVRDGAVVLTSAGRERVLDLRTGEPVTPGVPVEPAPAVLSPAPRDVAVAWQLRDGAGVTVVSDAAGGAPLWEVTARPLGVLPGSVLTEDAGATTVRDAATGAVRWSTERAWPVAFDGTRLVLAHRGPDPDLEVAGLSAVDLRSGATAWTLPVAARTVLAVGDGLLLEQDGALTALVP
ncbi:PQQ-binding-like beta-propeller repeat protein [Cellulomonas sp. 179-A 4D5 NHS]|uniref:outer membrane protein assembly factor BamB family protein n=1 Tax=Cellulomonas sp. 179-A 4D5 NHS TaxID=3142378 RepID=UPI00399F9A66